MKSNKNFKEEEMNPTPIKSPTAREIISQCPTYHVTNSLVLASQGLESPQGKGCACEKCIESALLSQKKIIEGLEKELWELKDIRLNAIKFLDTELCETHFQEAKKLSFDSFNEAQKDAGCRMCLKQQLTTHSNTIKELREKAQKVVEWWNDINPPKSEIANDFRTLTRDVFALRDAVNPSNKQE